MYFEEFAVGTKTAIEGVKIDKEDIIRYNVIALGKWSSTQEAQEASLLRK